ncbi:thiol reductant ABC exporter subunit CydC [Pseudonocardia charpentierae]|uniref:Thiol reductant ABC exporter subunit CydC n=1 Tax=Pseudonocardia charpentierae TaxID=3075545 RepID=A0ABU2N7W8_9PSEU|nr:thiol reductant ABC exporter subunit CydC [Pseudonocardia sp. DSM 45834]MDT0349379.1 thiol reductant ABC exporter subunit CydC [Pseudonocardia sp. DSM 45834]
MSAAAAVQGPDERPGRPTGSDERAGRPGKNRRDPLLRMLGLGRPRAGRFALGVLAGATATASGVGLLSVSAWLIAMAATQPPLTLLSVAIVATRALGILRGVARYLERLVTHDAALRTLSDARARVYARLARTEPVRRFRSGDLVTRLVSDTDATQDLLVRGLAPPAAAVVTGVGVVALSTALLAPGGALLAAGLLLAGVGVPFAAALAGRGPGRRATAARAELSTAMVDTVHGAPDLLAYGAVDRAVARVAATDAELTRVARRDAALLGTAAGASALIAGLTLWGTLLLGVAAVHDGALGGIPLAVLVLTALAAFEIVAPLPAAAARLGAVRAAGERLFGVLDVPPAVRARRDEPGPDVAKAALAALNAPKAAFATSGSAAGGVRIRDLRVRYGPDEPWALDGLDLDLAPGRRVAVVGPSGAGKSTLAEVLFRFRDPDGGTVHLDGVDVATRDPDDTRRVLSGMPQDPHVFATSLRGNLLLARPAATDDELRDVLRRVRLAEDVAALPEGLDTEVGPQGARLSGGMRGRLALARALLADPEVLVLDEPTTHLDPDTRDAVLDDILAATRGRTVLLVTHDLSHLDRFDEVAVVVGGRVVQRGTHTELLATDGWYRRAHARTP